MNAVIVTAAERKYFGLAMGLVCSIRDGERSAGVTQPLTIKLLDIGLDAEQRAKFAGLCDVVTPPGYHLPVDRADNEQPRLRSRAVKPFLREYFPGYELYVWLDSDNWVQRLSDLHLVMRAGMFRGLSLVPMIDRTYAELYRKDSELLRWMNVVNVQVFGDEVAQRLLYLPGFNAGVFAAKHDSPLWEHYARCLGMVFEKSKRVLDQPAFNAAIYENNVPYYPLPCLYNWVCVRSLPHLDMNRRVLTAPGIPFEPLGIVHITNRLMGLDIPLVCNDGKKRPVRLDYFGVREFFQKQVAAPAPQPQP